MSIAKLEPGWPFQENKLQYNNITYETKVTKFKLSEYKYDILQVFIAGIAALKLKMSAGIAPL